VQPKVAVYRIIPDPAAPVLRIVSHDMGIFDGSRKAPLSPRAPFRGSVTVPPIQATQFYTLAPGILAIPEAAWQDDDMYYCCAESGELLAIDTEHGTFRGINVDTVWATSPLDIAVMDDPDWRASVPDTGCPNLVRIGLRSTDLFCTCGVGVEGDQFKFIYDRSPYRGLVFELVWRDPGSLS